MRKFNFEEASKRPLSLSRARPGVHSSAMPFGPEPLGLAYFTGVKLIGYSMAGSYFRKKFDATRPRAVVFGAARTLLGLAVGVSFASLLAILGTSNAEALFFVLLVPVRFAEWWLTLFCFFTRKLWIPHSTVFRHVAVGSVWSFLLDVPAIVSMFVLPGGAWIC